MICFDLGNVIIECDVDRFYDQMKDFFSEEKYKQLIAMRDIIQTQHDLGIVTYQNFFEHFDMSLSKEKVNQILELWNQAVKPNDEMVNFICRFKQGRKSAIAFLSNIGYLYPQLKTRAIHE
jgi:CBS-domain-containing membrane protein